MQTCALCQEDKELQNSHYIAAAFFKAVAQGHAPYDQAIVHHDFEAKKVFRTNYQPKKKLLCSACEQLFSRKGENTLAKYCHRKDGQFLLKNVLEKTPASGVTPQGMVYYCEKEKINNEVDLDSFVYFAVSLLWRGSVTNWPKPYDGAYRSLGPKYEEDFRKYLLGKIPLISQISIDVQVDFDEPTFVGIISPICSREKIQELRFHLHQIFIPGIRIKVYLGKDIKKINQTSIKRSSPVTFYKWSFTNSEFFKNARLKASKNKAVGKLSEEVEELKKK